MRDIRPELSVIRTGVGEEPTPQVLDAVFTILDELLTDLKRVADAVEAIAKSRHAEHNSSGSLPAPDA